MLKDYLTVVNALFRNGPAPVPTMADVDIHWMGNGQRMVIRNDDAGFGGQYENANATIEWTVHNDDFFYSTANSSETNISHAYTLKGRNGVFYP